MTLGQKLKLIEESLQPNLIRSKACEKYGKSMACLSITLKNKETILKWADTFKKQEQKSHIAVVHEGRRPFQCAICTKSLK